MTQDDAHYRFRLRVFALARDPGNVRSACRAMGIHPSMFYRWKAQLERFGPEILMPRERRRPKMANQTSPFVEQRVVAFALGHPGFGPARISAGFRRDKWGGIVLSPNGCTGCSAATGSTPGASAWAWWPVATVPMFLIMTWQRVGRLPQLPQITDEVASHADIAIGEPSSNALAAFSHFEYGAAAVAIYSALLLERVLGTPSAISFALLLAASNLGWLPAVGLKPRLQGRANAPTGHVGGARCVRRCLGMALRSQARVTDRGPGTVSRVTGRTLPGNGRPSS